MKRRPVVVVRTVEPDAVYAAAARRVRWCKRCEARVVKAGDTCGRRCCR